MADRPKSDWRSWRHCGDWLTFGQKQTIDDVLSIILTVLIVGFGIWLFAFATDN